MKLKNIKEKAGDTYYTKYVFKTIDLIKNVCEIPNFANIFFLGYFYFGQVFLCNGKVYVAKTKMELNDKREPLTETMELTELYAIDSDTLELNPIIEPKDFNRNEFIKNIFTSWLEQPCDLNYEIDTSFSDVIKFLNNYTKETFSTNRYLFYSKKDNDFSFINNFYAFDKRNKAELKLYTFYSGNEFDWVYTPPQKLKDITIDDFGINMSDYQKRECKKAFLELVNQENEYFKVKNYWVMELIKLAIQPVLVLHEWSSHRCFCKPKLFGDIWVYDFPKTDEEPSFYITDTNHTKIAVLKFKSAEYLFNGIYKRGMAKAKSWKLNENEIKELIEFFNAPSNRAEENETGNYYQGYKKYVKTNWQQLIFEYNHNTACWGWGKSGFDVAPYGKGKNGIEQLTFDIPIPDYTQLLANKR